MRAPEAWLRAVEGRGHGELQREVLAPEDLVVEALITGLRLTEGVPEARLAALDPDWRTRLDPRARVRLQEAEHLDSEAGALRLTGAARLCLDAVLRELVAVPA